MSFTRHVELRARVWRSVFAAVAIGCILVPSFASAQIKVVVQDGRKIYVNDDSPAPRARRVSAPSASSRYVYWSVTQHRWKPVPSESPNIMKAARSAAAEVSSYINAMPFDPLASRNSAQNNPNYSEVARGRAVTSEEVDKAIEEAAARHNVDPNLVRSIIKVESNFNPRAVSRKGAMGLMQLMPATARELQVRNPFDPAQNVDAGVRHLKELLQNFRGDLNLTLAAYNAGAGAVQRRGGIPPYAETQNYVRRITSLYGQGGTIAMGVSSPRSAPIHVRRDERGVLTISNTE